MYQEMKRLCVSMNEPYVTWVFCWLEWPRLWRSWQLYYCTINAYCCSLTVAVLVLFFCLFRKRQSWFCCFLGINQRSTTKIWASNAMMRSHNLDCCKPVSLWFFAKPASPQKHSEKWALAFLAASWQIKSNKSKAKYLCKSHHVSWYGSMQMGHKQVGIQILCSS